MQRLVAGRRVVQPFCARSFRALLARWAEPVPDVVNPPLDVAQLSPKSSSKKRSQSPAPSPKPKTKKTSKHKSVKVAGEDLKRQKTVRKKKGPPTTRAQKAKQELGRSGFAPDSWRADWGSDELAPPPKRRAASKLRPRKDIVPADQLSSNHRLPPHRIPYVRRTEGYISDETEECGSILRDINSPSEHKPIAQLAHGLDRVLFNPGIYWLRDPRSRIYNFTPYLESIPAVTDFAFERVTGFVKSSMDEDLWKIAKKHKRPFAGSTSSLTGLLGHCYFLIAGDKEVDTSSLSRAFQHQPTSFTPGQRMPTSVVLNYREGVWLIDSDKTEELADKNILTWMGTMLEKFLTVSEGEFKKFLRLAPAQEEDSDTRREAYRYAMSDRFVMRSQLDCIDPRLPGTGVFDIKTRAAVPIRLDILNYEENSGYLIKTLTGPLESFEKEYYDLVRSAFLKYSFQARIGNMDGVLVAYHNTARIFGFQYVSLEEMEQRVYGSSNGTRVFNKCVSLLERVLSDAVSIYGERSVKCTVETRELSQELNVWVQPVEWDEEIEGKPCPITELDVRVVSLMDGEEVKGSRAVADGRGWSVHWTLTESALEADEIRRRLEAAQERQFRALSLPAGVETVEEMEKVWAKMDFGGKQGQETSAAMARVESPAGHATPDPPANENEAKDKDDGDSDAAPQTDGPAPSSDSPSRPLSAFRSLPSFREPAANIKLLRQLALQGREETLREEAEGREKVVWGSVEAQVAREVPDALALGGGGTLPSAHAGDETVASCKADDGPVVAGTGEVADRK